MAADYQVGRIQPQPWARPYTQPYTPFVPDIWPRRKRKPIVAEAKQPYANEIEVERGDHDALVTFYRRRGTKRTFVSQVTVPLGALDAIVGSA